MRDDLASALGLLPQRQYARMQDKLGAQLECAGKKLAARETVIRVADGLTKSFLPVLFVLTDERLIIVSGSLSASLEVVTHELSEITEVVVYPIDQVTIGKLFGSHPRHNNIFIGAVRAGARFFISEDSDIQFEAALRARVQGNPAV